MLPRPREPPQFLQAFDRPAQDGRLGAFPDVAKPAAASISLPTMPQSRAESTILAPRQRGYPAYFSSSPNLSIGPGKRLDDTEHMLRRKTPSGTLAAGYDGTPIQSASKSHPSKQIVLPAANAPPHENIDLNTQMSFVDLSQSTMIYNGINSYSRQSDRLGISLSPLGAVFSSGRTDLPQLTSMNNGIPPYEPISAFQSPANNSFYNNAFQIPTVLQPPFQPCLGPTASNNSGFFYTYGSEASCLPYRPAVPRGFGGSALHNLNIPHYSMSSVPSQRSGQSHDNSITRMPKDSPALYTRTGGGGQEINPPDPFRTPSDHFLPALVNETTNFHSLPPQLYNPATLYAGGKSQNAHFKEKTLTWAHTVYVDLLSHLHKSKKNAQQSRRLQGIGRSYSHGSVYPKPPRQPGTHFPHSNSNTFARGEWSSINSGKNIQRNNQLYSHHSSTLSRKSQLLNRSPAGSFVSIQTPDISTRYMTDISKNNSPLDTHFEQSNAVESAKEALELLTNLCRESHWTWVDGMLLGGCLAYGLENYDQALDWYTKIVAIDPGHIEAISNIAATLLSLNRNSEAEKHWRKAIKLRPSYFEAVEHLVGLLCNEHRGKDAVSIIEFVESSLRIATFEVHDLAGSDASSDGEISSTESVFAPVDYVFDFDAEARSRRLSISTDDGTSRDPGFGSSGFKIAGSENGRLLSLIHAKGNMLYALGDIAGAARAFEDAILIGAGRKLHRLQDLIRNLFQAFLTGGNHNYAETDYWLSTHNASEPLLLLPPDKALRTAKLVFPEHGQLPGLRYLTEGPAKNAAISTMSNSLLSLAKIFQDGMSASQQSFPSFRRHSGIGDILALYYLSLSLQPSPSTANNVGILLASIPHPNTLQSRPTRENNTLPYIPGVLPGSGIALALAYYNYGLNLDPKHAHLYTNFGSLLKDIGQLNAAIKMYEQAVSWDSNFDIALANLANAVKDQGRISDAIEYYRRAVMASPDFAEAVCGLSNALNSVCDWKGRGGVIMANNKFDRWHVNDENMLCDAAAGRKSSGWMTRVVDIVRKQLEDGSIWGAGTLQEQTLPSLLRQIELSDSGDRWSTEKYRNMEVRLASWAGKGWEGARIVRLIERATKRAMHRWYRDKHIDKKIRASTVYARPQLPISLTIPAAPTVLPFHTFTCPLSAKVIRMISQRNALRISCSTLRQPWLPALVYPPPSPPNPQLNIGYVSSDFNNHPLAHLMQSVFGLHDPSKVRAFCYATTASDRSIHREQIEREAPVFRDVSSWAADRIVQQIVDDGIHILVNLNGYTRGARNEIFAARPAPIQMSFMGFAGTLGAEWCDYLLADKVAIPPETLRPWRRNVGLEDQLCDDDSIDSEDWVYSENIIFCKDTFFCCDHRQSSADPQIPWAEEEQRRWSMRKELFPNLNEDVIILGNFNQLYKIEPTTFRTWLRILANVPNAVLWLLRFPDLGESNLKSTARIWAGEEVASRIFFTDVAPKSQHISRARVCDLFLDTPECNAHTTAADVLWSSTPLLTLPRYQYKMCSRMAASILTGALPKSPEGRKAAKELIARDEAEYEEFAIRLAKDLRYDKSGFGKGRIIDLRKMLYENRPTSALFDTKRWVSDLESAFSESWRKWVDGTGGDIYL